MIVRIWGMNHPRMERFSYEALLVDSLSATEDEAEISVMERPLRALLFRPTSADWLSD